MDRRGFLRSSKGTAGLVPAYRDQIPSAGRADAAGQCTCRIIGWLHGAEACAGSAAWHWSDLC